MKIVPKFESEFPTVEEGIHLFVIEDAMVKAKDDGKYLAKITARAEGGPSDGILHFENFGWSTGSDEFGIQKFAGFLVKIGAVPPEKCDTDLFESEAFRNRIKEKLVGKTYGAKIIHKKTNQGNVMSNSVAFYTSKEAATSLASSFKFGSQKAKPAVPANKEESEKDDWA